LKQTFNNYEIIVVDDGSQEDIEGLLKPYTNKVSYIRIQNSGPAAARNVGIKASKGEFIALLDHDDIWASDNLMDKLEILQKNPDCAMVYSYPELIDFEGKGLPQEYPSAFPSGLVFEDFLHRNWITTFSCTLIRKNIFDVVGILDARNEVTCCDDYDMWLRVADVYPIIFSPDKHVHYRIHDNNLMKNHDVSLHSHMTVFRKALKQSKTVASMSNKKHHGIIKEHMYRKYHQYAFKFYYDKANYKKTRDLLWRCILLKPFGFNVWKYFLICSLPSSFISRLRSVKNSSA